MGACWLFPLQVLGILPLIQWVCRCSGWCRVMDFSVVVVAHVQPRSLVMGVEVARDCSWRLGGSSLQLETAAAAQGVAATSDRSWSLSCCLQHHVGRKAVMVGPPLPPRAPCTVVPGLCGGLGFFLRDHGVWSHQPAAPHAACTQHPVSPQARSPGLQSSLLWSSQHRPSEQACLC